jgi:mannose-6-phosphate isomerase-like protein (cupin superfamily)
VAGYTIKRIDEVPDVSGDLPGEIRFLRGPLETEQVSLSHRRIALGSGGTPPGRHGHRHKTQEEIYLVTAGMLKLKLDDDVVEVGSGTAVRIGPEVARSVWNDGPGDAELLILSTKIDDLRGDVETLEDFWPEP